MRQGGTNSGGTCCNVHSARLAALNLIQETSNSCSAAVAGAQELQLLGQWQTGSSTCETQSGVQDELEEASPA